MPSAAPNTALEAVARRRFLLSGWPWRSLGYLLTAAVSAFAAILPLMLLGSPWAFALRLTTEGDRPPYGVIALLIALGLLLFAGIGPLVALSLATLERRRLRLVDPRPHVEVWRAASRSAKRAWCGVSHSRIHGCRWRAIVRSWSRATPRSRRSTRASTRSSASSCPARS